MLIGNAAMVEGQLSDLNGALDRIAFYPEGTQEALKECTESRLLPVYKFLGEWCIVVALLNCFNTSSTWQTLQTASTFALLSSYLWMYVSSIAAFIMYCDVLCVCRE